MQSILDTFTNFLLNSWPTLPVTSSPKVHLLYEDKPDVSAVQVEQSREAVEAEAVQAVGDVHRMVLAEKLSNNTESFGPLKKTHKLSGFS